MDLHLCAAVLGRLPGTFGDEIEHLEVEEGFPAKEGQGQFLWLDGVKTLSEPVAYLVSGGQGHLVDRLVPLAVVTLQTVIAGEVALQRRQDGEVKLLGVLVVVDKELLEGVPLCCPVLDDEAVLGELGKSRPFLDRKGREAIVLGRFRGAATSQRGVGTRSKTVEQRGDVGRDDELRVRKRVHQEHRVVRERDAVVEHGGLHDCCFDLSGFCVHPPHVSGERHPVVQPSFPGVPLGQPAEAPSRFRQTAGFRMCSRRKRADFRDRL